MSDVSDQRRYYERMMDEVGAEYRRCIADLQDENDKLRKDLEFERSENGWAREFLNRMGQKCGTKDCPSLVAYVTNLEAENTKLREMAPALRQCLEWESCKGCPMQDDAGWCVRDVRLRELGVEVD